MASRIVVTLLALLLAAPFVAAAEPWQAKLTAALDSPLRSEQEKINRTPELKSAKVLDVNPLMTSTDTRGVFDLEPLSFWVEDLDLVLTFRNAHNLTPAGRNALNEAVFEALRPGGHYGVIDHTRRHMEPDGPENSRRVDPVRLIHEALAAGFEFVAWSDLHYRADDELRFEVGRRSVTGNTDRFTLLFRKPES